MELDINMKAETQSSVGKIRTRLLILLGRAFIIVLLFILLVFLGLVGYFLTSTQALFQIESLQGYYLGHGDWKGAEQIFELDPRLKDVSMILLDEDQRIILDRTPDSVRVSGMRYEIQPDDFTDEIIVNGKKAGTLVVPGFSFWVRLRLVAGILVPVGIISFFLAIFALVVAILLTRRFVNPLADVIYAAREVTHGKFGTRISSEGSEDMRSLSDSFNEMASSLERNDRERRDLLADIAHELRTPLSIIRGRLEGIVDGIYSADGTQVSLALEQTYLLERLVEDLRLLTLAETRQLHFEKKTVDLAKLAEHIVDMFSAEAQEKNISLTLEKGNGNYEIQVDPQRLEQVIGNLVGNALRYVSDDSKIWITLEETSKEVKLSVQDNGPGVDAEELPYLFDRFWRKEKSRARSSGGTGLGLAIAKQLVEAQHGTIEAFNGPEAGLHILIKLQK